MDDKRRIAIAGATGFVGRALIETLRSEHSIIALSRSPKPEKSPADGVEWRACDLFSLKDAEQGLAGADAAFYLVHSMLPSARLTQGSFRDLDLICADNFARAAKRAGVKQIVYLGGLMPSDGPGHLSQHLESRLEVEHALGSHGVPLIALRAGLLIGAGGSSFQMMYRLVERLPFMIGPRWTRSLTQAVAVDDAIRLLRYALEHPELSGKAYDIGAPDVLSYADMLRLTGEIMGKDTQVVTVPFSPTRLSLLWVTAITGAPPSLVLPLVESLRHDMVARDGLTLQKRAGLTPRSLREALTKAIWEQRAKEAKETKAAGERPRSEPEPTPSQVRSVQRLPLPQGRDSLWVAEEFTRWLPRFMRPFLRVDVDASRNCRFYLTPLAQPLLELTFAKDRSAKDRQLFFVTGGLLANVRKGARPRLEFRTVLEGRFVLAAIHDFEPRLPWFIYSSTQALVHLLVMKRFAAHLSRDKGAPPADLRATPNEPRPKATGLRWKERTRVARPAASGAR